MRSKLETYDREDRPWAGHRLTSSAIVGHTTQKTSKIWVRVWEEGHYCLIVSDTKIDSLRQPTLTKAGKESMASTANKVGLINVDASIEVLNAQTYKAKISYSTDNTHVFDVKNLKSGKTYYYALFSINKRHEKWEVGRDRALFFSTMNNDDKEIRFGLFSCHMPFKGRTIRNMYMWEHFFEALNEYNANFVIGCGDQVYTDGDDKVSIWEYLKKNRKEVANLSKSEQVRVMRSWYRDIYRGYWGDMFLRSVYRRYPTYMIWDDHEIMDGWGSYTDKELSNHLDTWWEWENKEVNLMLAKNMFKAATDVYNEYQHCHNPGKNSYWDYSYNWAYNDFYVLDMRGDRDYNRKKIGYWAKNKMLVLRNG